MLTISIHAVSLYSLWSKIAIVDVIDSRLGTMIKCQIALFAEE